MKVVQLIIEKNAARFLDWGRGIQPACEGGHLEIVRLMLEREIAKSDSHLSNHFLNWNWNWGLRDACREGHLEIAQLMLEQEYVKGVERLLGLDEGLSAACEKNHVNIVQLMVKQGANPVCKHCGVNRSFFCTA